jgi:hypothetical protein
MELKKIKLAFIKYCPYNPRKIDENNFDKLKQSMKEFGYVSPILINKKTGWVVGGNQRLKVLNEMYPPGHEVEVIEINIDEEKEKALNLALNKISGEWNYEELGDILKNLDEQYFDFTGFDKLDVKVMTDITSEENIFIGEVKDVEKKYPLIFLFDDEQERDSILAHFKSKNGPDINKLKKLIANAK